MDVAYLTDTWTPAGVMNLVNDSLHVYPVVIDEEGNASPSEIPLSTELYELIYTPGAGFRLQFLQEVEGQAYVIRYKTQLVNTSGDPIITGSGTVNNKVETGQGKESSGSGGYGQQGLIKRMVGTDVGNKEIKYEKEIYVCDGLLIDVQCAGYGAECV